MKNLINSALIWKELLYNKWIYILGIIVGLYPSLKTAVDIVNYNYNMEIFNYGKDMTLWSERILRLVEYGNEFEETAWIFIAIAFGIYFIAIERVRNTIEYLASTPVSRTQIVTSKYVVSSIVLFLMVLLNGIFYIVASKIWTAEYTTMQIIKWIFNVYGIIFIIYSISFLISTVVANWIAAAITSLVVIFIPTVVPQLINETVRLLFNVIPQEESYTTFNITTNQIMQAFFLQNYVGILNYKTLIGYIMGTLVSIVIGLLLYLLSMKLFERNNFEKNDRILLFGDFKWFVKWIAPIAVSLIVTQIIDSIYRSLFERYTVDLIFIGFYILFVIIAHITFKIRKNIGYR